MLVTFDNYTDNLSLGNLSRKRDLLFMKTAKNLSLLEAWNTAKIMF